MTGHTDSYQEVGDAKVAMNLSTVFDDWRQIATSGAAGAHNKALEACVEAVQGQRQLFQIR